MNKIEDQSIMEVLHDTPWAVGVIEKLTDNVQKGFLSWFAMTKTVAGTKEDDIKPWIETFTIAIDQTISDMVIDMSKVQDDVMADIKKFFKKLRDVCTELKEPTPVKIGANTLCLYEEKLQLAKEIKKYEEIIEARKEELNALNKKQASCCKRLKIEPKVVLSYPPLPSREQLEELHANIEELEAMKFEREELYIEKKHFIEELVNEIKYKPNNEFEKMVLTSHDFVFSSENMEQLDLFVKDLEAIKKSTKEEIDRLRLRIEDLWKLLEVDLRDQDEFRSHYTGISLDTLQALRAEDKRCNEIKKANIKVFVDKLRDELAAIWTMCHCSEEEKNNFEYFDCDYYSEDLLEIFEVELQKWKNYYEENKKLLHAIEKHQELWKRVITLEETAATTSTNRYKNRGGKLLLEEKERNKLSTQVPKLEEQILLLAEQYSQKYNVPFLTYGKTAQEHISQLHEERENQKKLKLSARKQQRDATIVPGTSKAAMALFPSTSNMVTPTMTSNVKRKINATPKSENIKRLKSETPKIVRKLTPRTIPKVKVTLATMPLATQKRRSRTSLDKRRRQRSSDKIRKATTKSENTPTRNPARDTTYSHFESTLSNRCDNVNSTFTENAAPLVRTPSRPLLQKTPVKTPIPKSLQRTPGGSRTPVNRSQTKLSTCRSNLKLMF
ncbi:hypothetical protein ABEB36_003761 [Hypothenemus hampei]|uniref:Protein regulator of cytokinesis 1 n=1 Tax=Hypothenemus hampei TaxID=57062 RepID=A0ABD1F128_HYPHA